jgi:sphingomyelin phosphodiesterase acid-like 3
MRTSAAVTLARLFVLLAFAAVCMSVSAETPAPSGQPVLMLSDIHLDPLHDPAKFAALDAAPADAWETILEQPASAGQPAAFAHLQQTCGARGADTPFALYASSLKAEHERVPHPLFITVSGDLMAHVFECRYRALSPQKFDAKAYSAFAAKTIAFVALMLRQTFPGVPVYIALGNNDSGCVDYREDVNSDFLRADADAVAAGVPDTAERASVLKEFPARGDYLQQRARRRPEAGRCRPD